MIDSPGIFCVIVAYRPDCSGLNNKIRDLAAEFKVVVVSNADGVDAQRDFERLVDNDLCFKIPLGANQGIGAAQNVGIEHALGQGAKYVLLLDDDSEIGNADIIALKNRYCQLASAGMKVGAVATAVVDADSLKNMVHTLDLNQSYTMIRDLMSSGTLISSEILRVVGPMREDLFIDCVDYEWGWRCLRRGFMLVVDNEVKIRHRLGQSVVKGPLGLAIRVPAPIRHYYQFRNVIALILYEASAPLAWRLRNTLALLLKLPIYLVMLDVRSERASYIFAGIRDGFKKHMGKYAC